MKQSERIIKKGDYYEIEVVEDTFSTSKISKKDESQTSLPAASDCIVTAELPSFNQARSNYYFTNKSKYQGAEADDLLHELEDILNTEKLVDQDKQEIIKLIREVKGLKEENTVPLSGLTKPKIQQISESKINNVDLRVRLDLKELENKVSQLEKFTYPEISKLEHQLQVLLGQKKIIANVPMPKDDRNKQDIQNIFSLFNGLKCVNDLPGLVSKVHGNNGKYVQMSNWVNKIESSTIFHSDFLSELKEDELLLAKLQQNFNANVQTVKQAIAKIKQSVKK